MKQPLIIFLVVLAAYLLTAGGHLYSPDEEVLFRTTRALATGQGLAIEPLGPPGQTFASRPANPPRADGREYAQYGIGQPLLAVPFYWAGAALARRSSDAAWLRIYGDAARPPGMLGYAPTAAELAPRWACSWFNVLLGAALAALLYLICFELTGAARASFLAALLYALGSLAWPHSRPFFTEACAAFFIMLSWYALLRALRGRLAAWCLAAGAAAGFAALVRNDSVLAYPGLAVLMLGPVVAAARERGRPFGLAWAAFALPALVAGGVLLALNKAHFGGFLKIGYADQPEGVAFSTPLAAGLFGFLFSAGKGLFFFSPVLILGFWSWGPLARLTGRRSRWIIWGLALAIAVPLAIHATWQNWPGGWCWGPRHIFLIHPFLAIPAAAWLAGAWGPRTRILALTALVAGVAVQLLGSSQDFIGYHDRFFRSPGDPRAAYMFYDPLDEQFWSMFYQVQFRAAPEQGPIILGHLSLPRPIQDSIFIPQCSVWSGYPQMLREGRLDNFWVQLARGGRQDLWTVGAALMALRIIAGERKGAVLTAPRGLETRPTLGRVRESLFMILMPCLAGARVLDGFAGSGILGLEALSRGAARATFIEQARPALEALRANIAKLGWEGRTRVAARDAPALLRQSESPWGEPFDLIFLDPPYGRGLCALSLELLATHREAWLAPEGIVIAQHGRRDPLAETYGPLSITRIEHYSETRIAFYRAIE